MSTRLWWHQAMAMPERVTFYDEHPFDWVPPDPASPITATVSRALVDLIETLDANSVVLDIGCGPGRVLGHLAARQLRCIGVDRSRISMELAVSRYSRPGVVADNLALPLVDECADVVVSDGVIHHTGNPLAAFAENCRILKPNGQMYLAVYRPTGHYPWIYKYPGALIRAGLRHMWSTPLVTTFAQFPYFLVHFVRSRGRRTWSGARNLFYDYFITPHVAFLSRELVEEWCSQRGLRVSRYDENRGGNVHCFCLRKESRASISRGVDESASVNDMNVVARGA
jgi:SAM-dependent methyltransferase